MLLRLKNKEYLIVDQFRFKCSIGKKGLNSKKKEGGGLPKKRWHSLGVPRAGGASHLPQPRRAQAERPPGQPKAGSNLLPRPRQLGGEAVPERVARAMGRQAAPRGCVFTTCCPESAMKLIVIGIALGGTALKKHH